jgi:hypothetical protein
LKGKIMQVKLLIARAAASGSQNRGDIVEVTDAEAVRMIEAKQAEPVRAQKAPEKAVKRFKHERATK